MYVIISHFKGTEPTLILDNSGEVAMFTTRILAEQYAKETCAWHHLIVDLSGE